MSWDRVQRRFRGYSPSRTDGPFTAIERPVAITWYLAVKEIAMRWMLGIGLSAFLLGAIILALRVRLLPPTSTQSAIAAVLDEQGIAYQQVQIVQGGCIPAPEHCQVYVTEVTIIDRYRHSGRVECVRLGVGCRLWVASLGIRGAPLLDLAPQWSGVRAIENVWQHIKAWFDRPF